MIKYTNLRACNITRPYKFLLKGLFDFEFLPETVKVSGNFKIIGEGFYKITEYKPERNVPILQTVYIADRDSRFEPSKNTIYLFNKLSGFQKKIVLEHEKAHQFFIDEQKTDIFAINNLLLNGYCRELIYKSYEGLICTDIQRLRFIFDYLSNL